MERPVRSVKNRLEMENQEMTKNKKGRPRVGYHRISVRVPDSIYKELKKESNVSSLVVRILRTYFQG